MSITTRTRTGMTGLALAFATGAALLLSGCGTTDDTSTPAAVSVPGVAPAGSDVPLSPPPLPGDDDRDDDLDDRDDDWDDRDDDLDDDRDDRDDDRDDDWDDRDDDLDDRDDDWDDRDDDLDD